MSKKLTTKEFISKSIVIHGNKYEYYKSLYTLTRFNENK
jgi:hypothetical protein